VNPSYDQLLAEAGSIYRESTDWVEFFRAVFGADGLIQRSFPEVKSRRSFENSPQYQKMQAMLAELRRQPPSANAPRNAEQVVTLRLPQSVHRTLRLEADERHTSLNKLCISKLLQSIDDSLVPTDIPLKEEPVIRPNGVSPQPGRGRPALAASFNEPVTGQKPRTSRRVGGTRQ
jgi:predicted HicB family RNase H-like nuclease